VVNGKWENLKAIIYVKKQGKSTKFSYFRNYENVKVSAMVRLCQACLETKAGRSRKYLRICANTTSDSIVWERHEDITQTKRAPTTGFFKSPDEKNLLRKRAT